jgi:hypothetical protein
MVDGEESGLGCVIFAGAGRTCSDTGAVMIPPGSELSIKTELDWPTEAVLFAWRATMP